MLNRFYVAACFLLGVSCSAMAEGRTYLGFGNILVNVHRLTSADGVLGCTGHQRGPEALFHRGCINRLALYLIQKCDVLVIG